MVSADWEKYIYSLKKKTKSWTKVIIIIL
jgi:hypothetical protein